MKNKILNLIALVAIALCFSTFTLAKTKTNLPAAAEKSSVVQTDNAPTFSAVETIFSDSLDVNTNFQNKNSVANVATDGTNDAIITRNYFDGGTSIEINEPANIERMIIEPDNLYLSTARATNFRPPSKRFGLTIYEKPKRPLKRVFDAVNRYQNS